jgi:hypothetical protein
MFGTTLRGCVKGQLAEPMSTEFSKAQELPADQ